MLLSVVVLLSAAPGCGSSQPSSPVEAVNATASTELSVQGVTCGSCGTEPFGPDPAITAICQAGCAAQVDYDEADVVAQPGAKVGDLTRCPVSGVVFFVQQDQPHVEVNGQTWYTCSMCAGKLAENPRRFVRS